MIKICRGCAPGIAVGTTMLVILLLAGGAGAVTQIDSCRNISSPGEYLLNTSIMNSSLSSCFNITSSDVILDGGGNTIDGMDVIFSYGVYVYNSTTSLTNVIVKNIKVADWYSGIYFFNISNGSIGNNTANSTYFGIHLSYHSNNNMLIGNNASNNQYGIIQTNSDNNTLSGNTASNNSNVGIDVISSSNNTLSGNTANSNKENGIVLEFSRFNMLNGNTVNLNNVSGIFLEESSENNMLEGNNANSNNFSGIRLESSSNNTLTNNNAGSNGFGISLFSSSNNIIYNNYFNNTNNALDNRNNIWNIAKTLGTNIIGGPYLGGNFWSDYAGVDTDGDGLGNTLVPYNSSGNIGNGGDYLPLTRVKSAPAPVPALTPVGLIIIAGLLSVVAINKIRKREKH